MFCFSCHAYEVRSAKQLLSRTAAFSAVGALSPPWSQPSSQLRGRSGRQSDFAQGLSVFSLLQTPARENQLSAFDPYRYPVRRNTAFPLTIAFADKKGEMCCVSAVEEPDTSRASGICVQRGHTWGATQPTSGKESWCVQVTGPDPLLLPSPTLRRNGPSILAQ